MTISLKRVGAAFLLLAILVSGGIQLPLVGTAYILDLLVAVGAALFCLSGKNAVALMKQYFVPIIVGFAAFVCFTICDCYNGIDRAWLIRGIGTNMGCYLAFICGLGILMRFGVGSYICVLIAMMLSIPVASFFYYDGRAMTAEEFFKFSNGLFVICPILFFVQRRRVVSALVVGACSAAIYIYCDFRTAAAIGAFISLWLVAMPIIGRLKPWVVGCIALVLIPAGTVLSLDVMHTLGDSDLRRTLHMEASDSVRAEMARDAITKIIARPFWGYGSWQQVLQFVSADPANDNAVEGVHSVPLQLGYEYGLPGLLLSAAIAFKIIRVFSRLSYYGPRRFWFHNGMLPQILFIFVFTVENFLYGAVMGITRFMVGMELALLVWLDSEFRVAVKMRDDMFCHAPKPGLEDACSRSVGSNL